MESNSPEKKPKRPRIGQAFRAADDPEARPRFERPSFSNDSENGSDASDSYHQPRPYQPRPYNSQGGYNNGGQQRRPYNNQGYNRPYQQRTPYNNNNAEGNMTKTVLIQATAVRSARISPVPPTITASSVDPITIRVIIARTSHVHPSTM